MSTQGMERFTPRSQKVLGLALREALSLGHNYVGTEHILLGLVREGEGVAARVLHALDLDAEKIRNEVIRQLTPLKSKPARPRNPALVESLRAAIDELSSALAEAEKS